MLMDMLSDEELEARIEDYSKTLEQSQHANCHPDQYPEYRRLSTKEHFEMWDEMWKLVCERDARKKMKSVGS